MAELARRLQFSASLRDQRGWKTALIFAAPALLLFTLFIVLPIIEAKLVKCPVLLARGQYDGIATEADILDFYSQLPNPDRPLSILPGLAHSLTLGLNRQPYWPVANAFLGMPKAPTG